jgi:hypothetical protein
MKEYTLNDSSLMFSTYGELPLICGAKVSGFIVGNGIFTDAYVSLNEAGIYDVFITSRSLFGRFFGELNVNLTGGN